MRVARGWRRWGGLARSCHLPRQSAPTPLVVFADWGTCSWHLCMQVRLAPGGRPWARCTGCSIAAELTAPANALLLMPKGVTDRSTACAGLQNPPTASCHLLAVKPTSCACVYAPVPRHPPPSRCPTDGNNRSVQPWHTAGARVPSAHPAGAASAARANGADEDGGEACTLGGGGAAVAQDAGTGGGPDSPGPQQARCGCVGGAAWWCSTRRRAQHGSRACRPALRAAAG